MAKQATKAPEKAKATEDVKEPTIKEMLDAQKLIRAHIRKQADKG